MELTSWSKDDYSSVLGDGMSITLAFAPKADDPQLEVTFAMLDDQSAIFSELSAINATDDTINIGGLSPVVAEASDSKLDFGTPSDIRILTAGALNYMEFAAPLLSANVPCVSTWSALLYNQETKESLSIGHLTFDIAQPVVITVPQFGANPALSLHVISEYDWAKQLAPGDRLDSEIMVMDFGQGNPFDAVELHGDRIKAWHDIETWLERHPEIGVPAGWNSWSGSGSSGGYGTGIDEQIIVDNMEVGHELLSDRRRLRPGGRLGGCP